MRVRSAPSLNAKKTESVGYDMWRDGIAPNGEVVHELGGDEQHGAVDHQIEEAQGEEEERQREEEDDGLHQGVHQPEHEGHEEHIQVPPGQVDTADEVGRPG